MDTFVTISFQTTEGATESVDFIPTDGKIFENDVNHVLGGWGLQCLCLLYVRKDPTGAERKTATKWVANPNAWIVSSGQFQYLAKVKELPTFHQNAQIRELQSHLLELEKKIKEIEPIVKESLEMYDDSYFNRLTFSIGLMIDLI